MELYLRQQFDFLLMTAVERFTERLVQRNAGAGPARARLAQTPQGEGVWLDEYAGAILSDFLLDNVAGACFLLQAMANRSLDNTAITALIGAQDHNVESLLVALARRTFADLLRAKTLEALEQASLFEG